MSDSPATDENGAPPAPGQATPLPPEVSRPLDDLATGGLGAATEAMDALDTVLDPPTAQALAGVEEALAGVDLTGPLLRTLRAGLPDELGWPALEEAVAELTADGAAIDGVTSTWPVLTVFGRDRAIAVDHRSRRGACAFTVPPDSATHTVHHVGGDFLVAWTTERHRSHVGWSAFWASDPATVFAPERSGGLVSCFDDSQGALGYQFESADGGGRHDGERVLRPGGREGIGEHERQMTDGVRVWSSHTLAPSLEDWAELAPDTGERVTAGSLPDFFAGGPDPGWYWTPDQLTLVRLPEEVTQSPLGQAAGLSGFRVMRDNPNRSTSPRRHTIEGVDGRRASFHHRRSRREAPWGIVRMPADGAEVVATQHYEPHSYDVGPMACYAVEDGTLLWQARSFPYRREINRPDPKNRPVLPPPAFWHFLRPRDLDSSRALRQADATAARALLDAARAATVCAQDTDAAVRAAVARVLPGVTEPRIVAGVIATVERAAALLRRRDELARRVRIVRSDIPVRPPVKIADTDLNPALRGLVSVWSSPRPALLSALAADGSFLRGDIDDEIRRLSPPEPPRDWTPPLGHIDAVAWRLVVAPTGETDRVALDGLLRTWAAQPFAAPGTWRRGHAPGAALTPLCAAGQACVTGTDQGHRLPLVARPLTPEDRYTFVQRETAPPPDGATDVTTITVTRDDARRLPRLLDLLAEHGPLPLDGDAVAAFMRRTGVRRAVATLVLAGLPRRAEIGGDNRDRVQDHERMMRAKPYQASRRVAREADDLSQRLGATGRLRLLAAAMPEDPAELWEPSGTVAAAERMATVWVELIGARPGVDEETAAELETTLELDDSYAQALARPVASTVATSDVRHVLVADGHDRVDLREETTDGRLHYVHRHVHKRPYIALASLLAWVLTERPVGESATAGVTELYARLRARLDAPDLLMRLEHHWIGRSPQERARLFGPRTYPVRPDPEKPSAELPLIYDDGLLLVDAARDGQWAFLRPSTLADPDALGRVERLCAELDEPDLLRDVRGIAEIYDGGLARMVARAADTPVPAGGYEANPRLSVPELVEEVAGKLGATPDAAALYLQLSALARPTDRNVRRWNGWTAKRHKAVRAELVELGVVEEGKRSRAGRDVFLPGRWTALAAPELPLETAKLDRYLAVTRDVTEVDGPFLRLLPPVPLHELFAAVWAAR